MINPSSGTIRVLHVDDEPDFAEMAAEFIERQDERFDVETATNPGEALDRLHENGFDCIVSDFDMPGQNGIEFLETVREIYPDLPFILYTGKGSEEVASDAISAGVTEYLQKERGTSQYDVLANRIKNSVEKYRTKHELQDREQRLNLFFEQSPLGVIRWDNEFNFARLNDTAREILGYAEGELVGQPWEVVVPEADREEIADIVVSDLLADEGGYHSINENVRKDGERIVCEWHNWVVTDEDDEVVAVFSQFQDITERKERERELSELEQFNRKIVENAPVGLFRLDDRMRITYENQRAEEIVGVPEGEDQSPAIGRDLRELQSVQDTDAIEALNRLEAGETVSFDTIFESMFGKESYLSGKGVPLFDNGMFDGAIIMVVDITERRETEQILEQLKQNIPDVVWMTDPDKDAIEFVSDSYEDIFGRSTELLRENPLSFVEAIHPEDRERVETALEDQRRNPGAYDEIYRIIRPNGDVRWVHDRSSEVYEDGELIRIVGIASDITQRKEREQAIEELHKTTDTLMEATTSEEVAAITVDAVRDILEMPATGVHLYDESKSGLVPVAWTDRTEEIVGKPPTFAPGEGLAGTAFETGEPQIYDDVSTVPERFNSDTDVRSQIIYPLDDRGVLVIGSPETDAFDDVDISLTGTLATHATTALERVERESELTRRQELFASILEASIDGILVIDENREYVTWNEQFIDMWDVPEELIGDKPEELGLEYILDQLERPQEFIDKVEYLYEHPHEESRDVIRLADGRVFDRYSTPVETDDGTYFGRVWFFRDITEQETRERELARQNERLEKFASVVSHDLRNPLNVAQGRLELAREQYDSEHLDSAANAVDRSISLIEDLLTLAREGKRASDLGTVDLGEMCDGCWQYVETTDATLVNEADRTIRADSGRLKQLLENLIRNAIEHGGEGRTVTIGDLDNGFYIADDGPGIPEEERDQVFDVGYSTTTEGTGFGLNIVREIAEAHGWTVSVTDSETGGARFEITGVESVR